MVTNNDIRRLLGLPEVSKSVTIEQVDAVGINHFTLMFINKTGMDLSSLDLSISSVFLIDTEVYPEYYSDYNDFIRVKNPKYAFCRVVERFGLRSKLQLSFPKCTDQMLILSHCKECIIGENCHFDQGVILGGKDFSPVMGEDRDTLVQFPQMGGVEVGNNVVVKYNTMIGRGTFGFTEIGDNCQIDYNCQIGHNCVIGKSCILAAGSIIGGSTIIGDNTTIGMGAMIRNGLKIGRNVSIGMGSVVIKDIPDNCVVVGNPARVIEHTQIFDERGLV